MNTVSDIRQACGELPHSIETFPFGPTALVFKVGGVPLLAGDDARLARAREVWKVYALTSLEGDPVTLSLKCDPVRAEALRAEYAAITPGYHLNKRHWNTLRLDGELPEALVRELLRSSYDLVRAGLPRDVRAAMARTVV